MMAPTSRNPKARKKEPPPFPPLKRLRLPEREEEEERFPDGLPRAKEGRRGPVRGEKEEEGADLLLRRERDNARLMKSGRSSALGRQPQRGAPNRTNQKTTLG